MPAGLAQIQREAAEHRRASSACPMEVLLAMGDGTGSPDTSTDLVQPSHATDARDTAMANEAGLALWEAVEAQDSSPSPLSDGHYAHDVEEIICMAQGMVQLPPDGLALKDQLVQIERSLIEQALVRTSGNVSQSARLLRLQRTTLIEKINKYDLRLP